MYRFLPTRRVIGRPSSTAGLEATRGVGDRDRDVDGSALSQLAGQALDVVLAVVLSQDRVEPHGLFAGFAGRGDVATWTFGVVRLADAMQFHTITCCIINRGDLIRWGRESEGE
jgi:hypothetical protein